MITYVKGTDLHISQVYKAFMIGFSDYIIKVDLAEASFISRFLGPEGNDLELCHVALDGDQPVGLVMGGIRVWDGLKTLRCGTLCIAPEHRGTEVTKTLLELHWKDAMAQNCDRISLEVIKGNDRAVRFYEKNGYFSAYDIKYYKVATEKLRERPINEKLLLKTVDFDTLAEHRNKHPEVHIHWQSETDYYKDSQAEQHFEIELDGDKAGYLSMSKTGKINYLWVEPQYRNRGVASSAILKASKEMALETINIALTNNGLFEGFVRALHFDKDKIEQFEMFNVVMKKGVC